jgi:hypothetical protein
MCKYGVIYACRRKIPKIKGIIYEIFNNEYSGA